MPLAQHCLELLFLGCILVGPLPLCLAYLSLTEEPDQDLKRLSSLAQRWLILLTAWCAVETCIGLLLGFLHLFRLGPLLTVEVTIFLLGVIILMRIRHDLRFSLSDYIRKLLTPSRPLNLSETIMLGAIALITLSLIYRMGTRAITNYDSLAFHLPTMAGWYQRGHFGALEQFQDHIASGYPYNWQVVCALSLLAFKEDFLIALPNLVAWWLLGLAIYLVCVRIGVNRTSSLSASCLVLSVPLLLQLSLTMHIDLVLATFFMVGLCLGIMFIETPSGPRRLLYGALMAAALGLLSGIKPSAPIYIGLIGGLLLILKLTARFAPQPDVLNKGEFKNSVSSPAEPHAIAPPPNPAATARLHRTMRLLGGATLLGALFMGSFWYVKNLVELGNPLGSVNLQFAGVTIFPGQINPADASKTSLAHLFHITDPAHTSAFKENILNNLYLPFIALFWQALLLPFVCIGVAVGLIRRTHSLRLYEAVRGYCVPLLLLCATGYLYWHTPFSASLTIAEATKLNPLAMYGSFRYGIPFLAAFGVAAAAGTKHLRLRNQSLLAIVLVSATSSAITALEQSNLLYLAVVLPVLWAGIESGKGWKLYQSLSKTPAGVRRFAGAALIVALLAKGTHVMRNRHDIQRNVSYWGIPAYLDTYGKPGEKVGYAYSHKTYLFHGKNLQHEVSYIPPRSDNLSKWLKLLRERDISIIAIGPVIDVGGQGHRIKLVQWLNDPAGPFIKVLGEDVDQDPTLYRFKNESPVMPPS